MADKRALGNFPVDYDIAAMPVRLLAADGTTALLTAPAALADGEANPTISEIAALNKGFNGTTWDRIRSGVVADVASSTGLLDALQVGIYNSSLPTITNGRYNALQLGVNGGLIINPQVANQTVFTDAVTGLRAILGPDGNVAYTPSIKFGFNGTTWDRERNNYEATVAASALRNSTFTSADLVNYDARGVVIVYDVTAVTASGSFTITVQAKDSLSGKYVTILTGTARSTTGTDYLEIYPGVTAAANTAVSRPLPRVWRVVATKNSGTDQTFSISANYVK
jgi:hypothetical protein